MSQLGVSDIRTTVTEGIDCCAIWHRPFTKGKIALATTACNLLLQCQQDA